MKKIILLACMLLTFLGADKTFAQEPYLGEIRMFAGNYAPNGWALCNGQILPISQNTALFAILGTTYGGNGQTTFALPDLRGRVPVHMGQGPGLSPVDLGETGGSATTSILIGNMPAHSHTINTSNAAGTTSSPAGALPANTGTVDKEYGTTANATMSPQMVAPTGGGQPINNMQPYLGVNFIIALEGIFPSPN